MPRIQWLVVRIVIRETIRDVLTPHGCQVDLASDGAEAIEKAARLRPDLITMDHRMPHMDGGAAGAISLRQAEEFWRTGADPLEFARDHLEFARAFESFPADADRIFPNWRNVLDDAA